MQQYIVTVSRANEYYKKAIAKLIILQSDNPRRHWSDSNKGQQGRLTGIVITWANDENQLKWKSVAIIQMSY